MFSFLIEAGRKACSLEVMFALFMFLQIGNVVNVREMSDFAVAARDLYSLLRVFYFWGEVMMIFWRKIFGMKKVDFNRAVYEVNTLLV